MSVIWPAKVASRAAYDALYRESLDAPAAPSHATSHALDALAQNTLDREKLRSVLYVLSERVAVELRRIQRRAEAAGLNLRYADFQTISRQRTLDEPTDEQQVIYTAARELLDLALEQRKEPVRLIGAGAQRLVDGGGLQLNLFEPQKLQHHRLNAALDGLRQRYGFTAIQQGRTLRLEGRMPGGRGAFVYGASRLGRG